MTLESGRNVQHYAEEELRLEVEHVPTRPLHTEELTVKDSTLRLETAILCLAQV